MYDFLIVGSGLYGAVCAHELQKAGRSVLVIEKRPHNGGNIYCENKEGINIHCYGAHIFHTSDKEVWDFVNNLATFNSYVNSPLANYAGELYNLPFNMNTFYRLWGVVTPKEAAAKIAAEQDTAAVPQNLEEQAIALVGKDIYTKLIKGYTEKQWGRSCRDLPPFIIKRLPVRYTFDNNYFNDRYQGIPQGGYNKIIEGLLAKVKIINNTDYNKERDKYRRLAKNIIYTGAIDEYFNYELGALEYRGLKFVTERLAEENYQGVAVMNYTAKNVPYTRIIEHKHFEFGTQPVTYITKEYPAAWQKGEEAYYPINDEKNKKLYAEYKKLAAGEKNVTFGGRLAEYQYYDMDDVIRRALDKSKELLYR